MPSVEIRGFDMLRPLGRHGFLLASLMTGSLVAAIAIATAMLAGAGR